MSKAEELAKHLETDAKINPKFYTHDMRIDSAAHLRALDASHQRLKERLIFVVRWWDQLSPHDIAVIRAALEQAKDLE